MVNHPHRNKRRSVEQMQRECDAFNKIYQVGDLIQVHPGAIMDPPVEVAITSRAYVLGDHTPVVGVTGGHGCVALSHVDRP